MALSCWVTVKMICQIISEFFLSGWQLTKYSTITHCASVLVIAHMMVLLFINYLQLGILYIELLIRKDREEKKRNSLCGDIHI